MPTNAEATAQLVTQLSTDQSLAIQQHAVPGQVATLINQGVGLNHLGNADELRAVANRVRAKAWLEFFNKELLPLAEKGAFSVEFYPDQTLLDEQYDDDGAVVDQDATWSGIRELGYFYKAYLESEEDIEDLAWKHGFWFDYHYDEEGYVNWCRFSWTRHRPEE